MKYLAKTVTVLICVVTAVFLLFLSDFSFSLSLIYKPFYCGALFFSVLTALSLIPALKESGTIWSRRPKITTLAFVAIWTSLTLFSMTAIRNAREAQGSSAYSNDSGNCSTLFTPVVESKTWQRWMSARPPFFRYANSVLEDACRVSELHRLVASDHSDLCTSKGLPNPSSCYRNLLDELTSHSALTTPGLALAMFDGIDLSMKDQTGDVPHDHIQRDLREYRLAANTFGLVEATLRASEGHASPELILGSSSGPQAETSADPEWEAIKIIYRPHGMYRQDEIQLLDELDREFESSLVAELMTSVKRINARIKKLDRETQGPARTEAAAEISSYKYEIDQYNEYFRTFGKGA